MKSNLMLIVLTVVVSLVGCNEISKESAHYPEEALKNIEVGNSERDISVYGSHEVNEELVLFVFRGVMNDKDVWVADVHKEDGQWVAKEIVQMNGPFEGKGTIQTVVSNEEFGYEVGYIKSNNSDTADLDLNIIEIEGIVDWKIWVKQF
jgi:hypothetical protein